MRQLAQHSAEAAKEIKQLIQASVNQVTQGVTQVRDAGQTMQEIVTSSRQVTQIMGEVVQASLSQSAKLQDVTNDLSAQDVSSAVTPQKRAGQAALSAARAQANIAIKNAAASVY